jgi:hypothetical protein
MNELKHASNTRALVELVTKLGDGCYLHGRRSSQELGAAVDCEGVPHYSSENYIFWD